MLDIYRQNMTIIPEQEIIIAKIENLLKEYLYYKKKFLFKKANFNWIYLYGDVGQGKTMIANLILSNFTDLKSIMIHCTDLINILQNNQPNPNFELLIIDEFEIRDIAASRLMRDYLARQAEKIIVFTSNKQPDDLYKNGLQRQIFIPAIEQIKSQSLVIEVNIHKDIRKEIFKNNKNFKFFNTIQEAQENTYKQFESSIKDKIISQKINVNNRYITLLNTYKNCLYIDFNALCNVAWGSEDYTAICKTFNKIFIGGFYNPDINNLDIVRRMIIFIDIAYLYKVKLIIGFNFDFTKLDKFLKIMPEISRAISRLFELRVEK